MSIRLGYPPAGSIAGSGLPVVVIGAGPVGLAAAAHLLERGLVPLVFEAGASVGASVQRWGHVRTFSPWRYNIDQAAARLLSSSGWVAPDLDVLPTGRQLVEAYLNPLAATAALSPRIVLGTRVTGLARAGWGKVRTDGRGASAFLVRVRDGIGLQRDVLAAAVIDASGTYGHPNPLGASGLPALGEDRARPWLSAPLPDVLGADRGRFAGRRVLVVGAGHSAATTLIDLAELAGQEPSTRVGWVIRRPTASRLLGGSEGDELPARGRLGARLRVLVDAAAIIVHTGFEIDRLIEPSNWTDGGVEIVAAQLDKPTRSVVADVIVAATGFRPDHSLAAELRLDLDPALDSAVALGPLIDPNVHSCETVPAHGHRQLAHPEPGYYIVGIKSYGRAPTFLMATGYEQVRSVAAALAGDMVSADTTGSAMPRSGACTVPADAATLLPAGAGGDAELLPVATGTCNPTTCG